MIPSRLKLRRAEAGDAEAIRNLTREVYAKWIAAIGREPRPMAADYVAAVRSHWIDLHEEAGQLVALVEMIPHPGHLLVENVAVRESHQGRGLGERLLDHATSVAQNAGLAELRLYTNAAFLGNLAFYRKCGFSETAQASLPGGGTMVSFSRATKPGGENL